jgi:hypothetical protein
MSSEALIAADFREPPTPEAPQRHPGFVLRQAGPRGYSLELVGETY